MLAAPLAGFAYAAIASFVFSRFRVFPPVGTPVFVVTPAIFVIAVFIRYRFARALIMRLAPAAAARRMLTRATEGRGMVASQDATVVFVDLIGSTTIAEKVSPGAFNALLNAYFDTAVESIERNHGQIAAFSGDGITAIFTGIHHRDNHAVRACRAVIGILAAMRKTNVENEVGRLPTLHMRVGMNSGEVAEGEIGARDRFNFSVVGDVVNMAARLEQMGRTLFPGENDVVLAGRATRDMAVESGFAFCDCGAQVIRGREQPEQVFRLETAERRVD